VIDQRDPRFPCIILASASPRRSRLLSQIGVVHRVLPVDADETPHANETPEDYVLRVAVEKARHGWERSGGELPVLAADTSVVLDGAILGKPRDEADALEMLRCLSGREHRVLSAVSLVSQRSGKRDERDKTVKSSGVAAFLAPSPCGGKSEAKGALGWERLESVPAASFNSPPPVLPRCGRDVIAGVPVNSTVRELYDEGAMTALSLSLVRFRALDENEIRAYWRTGEPCDKAGSYAIQGLGAVFIERLEGSYSGVMGLPLFETAKLLQEAGVHLFPDSKS
jgi:septum formation protein